MNYNEDISRDVKLRIGSQQEKIASQMWKVWKWYTASDFQGNDPSCVFIGYEAATRLGDLSRRGLLEKRWKEDKTITGSRVMEYRFQGSKKMHNTVEGFEIYKPIE